MSCKSKDQTIEDTNVKPTKDKERCVIVKGSRSSTHSRSQSTSGQKSKIPTNIGHAIRPATQLQSDLHNCRMLTSIASDDATVGKASPLNSGRFPTSRSLTMASSPTAITKPTKTPNSTGNSCMHKRQLESQFATKRKRYMNLKKELTEKQKNAVHLYDEMSQLRVKLIAAGATDPGKIDKINLPNNDSLTKLAIPLDTSLGSDEPVFIPSSSVTNDFVSSTISQIREIPKRCFERCNDMFHKVSEILDPLMKLQASKSNTEIKPEIAEQLEICKNEMSNFYSILENLTKCEETSMNEMVQNVSILWDEIEQSRQRITQLEENEKSLKNEMYLKLSAAVKEQKIMEEESNRLKEREHTTEIEVEKMRIKIRGMETKINEDQAKITQLQNNIKNLESQLKHKESVEKQLKEMEKSLKNSQSLLTKTEKQRDSFESRLIELKKSYGLKEKETEMKMKEMTEKLAEATNELTKEREQRQIEKTEVKENGDTTLDTQLGERDKKIETLQREKQEIIKAIFPEFFNDKCYLTYAGENLQEKIVGSLNKKMQEYRSNVKLAQEKNDCLQRQLIEYKLRGHGQSKDNEKTYWNERVTELQKQVDQLRSTVEELTHRNDELEIALNQKQLQIEEQDRIMREHNSIIKVRDEVIELITGNTDSRGIATESGHLSSLKKSNNQRSREQVDKQIAQKTENLQQLYSTLETKQMQVTRLEQLVEQMEIQQERAQEQRTRLEKKIAQLQFAMHYKKGHRYVTPPQSPTLTTTKVTSPPCREPSQNSYPSLSGAEIFSSSLNNSPFMNPRSSSRPPQSRSPVRQPNIQRSKTLHSFNVKKRSPRGKTYASQVMDEVGRALKRERDYNYKKHGLSRNEIAKYSMEDRGMRFVGQDLVDNFDVTKDEMHESFYNWLVEPWMFEGTPTNVTIPSNGLCENTRTADCLRKSPLPLRVKSNDRSLRKQKAINDCSRESRRGSPEYRQISVPEPSCPTISARARTSPQETRSRRQRS